MGFSGMSKTRKVFYILTGVIFFLGMTVVVLFLIRKDKADRLQDEILSDTVRREYETVEDDLSFCGFADKVRDKKEDLVIVKNEDINSLNADTYDCVQLSMWNDDICTSEWFEFYFARKLNNPAGIIESPFELREYLETCLGSQNNISKVFLCLDPDELEKQYYEDVYYDADAVSFEEYLSEQILSYMNAFSEVEFCIFLPTYSVSYLASLSDEALSLKLDNWYEFLMYLHWCDNASVSYLGSEEWIVAKDNNFVTGAELTDEVAKLIYLYDYAYAEYRINGPEFLEKRESLEKMIAGYRNGEYEWKGLEGRKVVFIGDSIFDCATQKELCIPGYFEEFTKASCYNLSQRGATAIELGTNNMCTLAKGVYEKEDSGIAERTQEDFYRLIQEISEEEDVLFVVNFGINDYFCGAKIYDEDNPDDTSTYKGALHKGINLLKQAYPNSEFVLVSPFLTRMGDYGTACFSDYGGTLTDYVKAAKEQAEIEDAKFINMYDEFNITEENMDGRLVDGLNPAFTENIFFARLLYEGICE